MREQCSWDDIYSRRNLFQGDVSPREAAHVGLSRQPKPTAVDLRLMWNDVYLLLYLPIFLSLHA